ncbi:peptidylprolyl isomerase [Dehalobacterium formicoaceticum]|uniref:peptidylprolyl isomerase n=1 Tax=Dehalobacterium formicoaceticum TaxID=51515 RepID=UPI000B7F5A1B|nr:peptidylprolyl isomerase [Dehalobacterium formicoaceticum]
MRQRFLFMVLIMAALLLAGCGGGEKLPAVVNGEEITQEQFDRYVSQLKVYGEQMGTSFEGAEGEKNLAALKEDAIKGLIYEKLVLQSAKKEKIEVSDQEINDYLEKDVKSSFENDEKYQEWLKSMEITEDEFKNRIAYQFTGQKLFEKITGKITVTDQAVKEFYEKDPAVWDKIKVSHILINAEKDKATTEEIAAAKEKALSVIKELDQGANFADLAKKYSGDPGSAAQGGVLDMEFSKNEQGLVPEFVAGSFQLAKVGDYSKEPVLSQFGYHIIKLDEKKGSLEEVKEDIRAQLLSTEKNTAFKTYMDQAEQEADIKNNISKE